MLIQENVPLAPLTTLGIGGPARYFVRAETEQVVTDSLDFAASRELPVFVLGGGSNILVSDAGFPGLVLRIALTGTSFEDDGNHVKVTAAAGEDWDPLVAEVVRRNLAGIECLSGIPGFVGGTPVQNVGAYGQEVSETITSVRALDHNSHQVVDLSNSDCGFGYRKSIFNSSERDRYIVLEVIYRVERDGPPVIRYADLIRHFADRSDTPLLQEVRDAVRHIRLGKAMLLVPGDPDCRSAGSFFKNPVVSQSEFDRITEAARLARILAKDQLPPHYPAGDGSIKLSAAWLIEKSGFSKGYAKGPVGLSSRHVLAIVNRGGATARDAILLVDEIQSRVEASFGMRMVPEPMFVGF